MEKKKEERTLAIDFLILFEFVNIRFIVSWRISILHCKITINIPSSSGALQYFVLPEHFSLYSIPPLSPLIFCVNALIQHISYATNFIICNGLE